MLLNRAPKFGNDDEYVDSRAAELIEHAHDEVTKHRNPRGGRYILGIFSYGSYIGHGIVTGATPDAASPVIDLAARTAVLSPRSAVRAITPRKKRRQAFERTWPSTSRKRPACRQGLLISRVSPSPDSRLPREYRIDTSYANELNYKRV